MMPKTNQLDSMSTEKLWTLYEDVRKILTVKMTDQQRDIERRLRDLQRLNSPSVVPSNEKEQGVVKPTARRPYPKVLPNYRNPAEPSETWSGRGNRPRWLSAQIANGKTLEQFLIHRKTSKVTKKNR
jgi:DNA-binding protein H-NS